MILQDDNTLDLLEKKLHLFVKFNKTWHVFLKYLCYKFICEIYVKIFDYFFTSYILPPFKFLLKIKNRTYIKKCLFLFISVLPSTLEDYLIVLYLMICLRQN